MYIQRTPEVDLNSNQYSIVVKYVDIVDLFLSFFFADAAATGAVYRFTIGAIGWCERIEMMLTVLSIKFNYTTIVVGSHFRLLFLSLSQPIACSLTHSFSVSLPCSLFGDECHFGFVCKQY